MEEFLKPQACKNAAAERHIRGTGIVPYAESAPTLSANRWPVLKDDHSTHVVNHYTLSGQMVYVAGRW